ncbi:hypothetical protein B9Z45_06075 [Limnohabitans sp. 2KL-17]|uniref:ATP-binding protein n=1 Tax=Limnohabitans sp. 2KL-17 TaxID=1100704 RepID=UPI000D374C66|nr:ATP-binding protein [Limnohabitans sp. 2KL-17]PUE61480.1 hypothetical protein B9Z45_06075 [Limnohabitans sp. 2KL-17]
MKLHKLITGIQERMSQRHQQGKPMFVLLLGLITLGVIFTIAIANPYQHSINSLMVFGAVSLAMLTCIYLGMSVFLGLSVGATVAVAHIVIVSMASGGIYSPRMVWLSLLPIAVFYNFGLKVALYWLAVTLLAVCAMAVWTISHIFNAPFVFAQSYATASVLSYALATVILMMVPWLYELMSAQQLRLKHQKTVSLQAKQVQLEHAQQMQEHFIASVSHELRTPMNAILGLNSVLLERVKDKPQASKVLAYTRQSADHLMTVINDVLDYSQFNTGQISARVERFALRQTVRSAFELFQPKIENTTLRYTCEIGADVPEWVSTDRHRLMQVLVNLLGNAIKFTHQGGVTLQVRALNGGVEFAIQDTGIGIASDQQQKIFERFSQADASIQSRYGGSGLGLTISQRLVQMLGGQLQLESDEGAGSRFWFWLPMQGEQAPTPAMSPPGLAQQLTERALKFLVVDDHRVNRLLASQVLMRQWPGSVVDECDDGSKAVQALQAGTRYDLVLMDMVMPVMDGIEATRLIRQSHLPGVRATPVLGLTANVNAQDLARFKQSGLNGLLLKPFDLAQLHSEVRRLLVLPT